MVRKKKKAKGKVRKISGVRSVKKHKPAKRKKKVAAKKPVVKLEKIGEVTHYFPKVKAAAVRIVKNSLKAGEYIYVKGHTTDFKERVGSMQLDHAPIEEGKRGQEIGLLVKSRVRIGDSVYRV